MVGDMDTTLYCYNADAVAEEDLTQAQGKGRYRFRLLSDKVNLNGVAVKIDGMDIARYEANPVVLYNHDRDRLPIGRALSVTRKVRSIEADVEFDMEDELAAEVDRKVKAGYLRAVSIGYRPKSLEETSDVTWPPWNDIVVHESSLSEISIVTIPADVTALRKQAEEVVQSFRTERLHVPKESATIERLHELVVGR